MRPQGGQRAADPDEQDLTSSSLGPDMCSWTLVLRAISRLSSQIPEDCHCIPAAFPAIVDYLAPLELKPNRREQSLHFPKNPSPLTPHFLSCEGAVICHLGPGRGTIAWAVACPLTPSQGPLIRLTFLQENEAITHTHFGHSWRWRWTQVHREFYATDAIEINLLK